MNEVPSKLIVEYSWSKLEEDRNILIGVEHSFLNTVGKIQSAHLPSVGDELRQGCTFFQIFSTDMRAHSILAPFSGTVVQVNQNVISNPNVALQDPYEAGWLIRLRPNRFEEERKLLGL